MAYTQDDLTKTKTKKETGSILITVLIFSIVMSLIAITIFETSILQQKMLNAFHFKIETKNCAESKITSLEKRRQSNVNANLLENEHFIQFVPDTLHFGEKQGIAYYKLNADCQGKDGSYHRIASTIAIRRWIEMQPFLWINAAWTEMMAYEIEPNTNKPQFSFSWHTPSGKQLSFPLYMKTSSSEASIYVLDQDFYLYGLNINGIIKFQMNLTDLSPLSHQRWRLDLLTAAKWNIADANENIIIVILPAEKEQVVALNIAHLDILWRITLPQMHSALKPMVILLPNGRACLMIAHASTREKNGYLSFYDLQTGQLLHRKALAKKISLLTPVDSHNAGYVDIIYLKDDLNQLWKLKLKEDFFNDSELVKIGNVILGKIKKIIVGDYAAKGGRLLYLLVANHSDENIIYALWDKNESSSHLIPYFETDIGVDAVQMMLRQGILIVSSALGVKTLDAFSGKIMGEEKIQPQLQLEGYHPSVEELCVIQRKPLAKDQGIFVPYVGGLGESEVFLDDTHGRSAWEEF